MGRSAFETAWYMILSNQGNESTREDLWDIFPGREHIEDLDFTLLHRTVLKLNPLDLNTLLASIPREMIDERDARGRTALWWAVRRADYDAIASLLDYGADFNSESSAGCSVLSTALGSIDQT